jgi:hypothetical protein
MTTPFDKALKQTGRSRVLTKAEFAEVARRYLAGETATDLAVEYGVKAKTLRQRLNSNGIRRNDHRIAKLKRDELHDEAEIVSENRAQSHRENLAWAIDAAGRHLRTGEAPQIVPNNAAFFLYKQAIDEPKDFLTKVNQLELKRTEQQNTHKKACEKTIAEIDDILAAMVVVEAEKAEATERTDVADPV